ncbi:MAG: spondin domain-containing protein [Gammaproteobacteria bacterium]|nr:spondin domain-containing protein [Gammaproteobacteria bacterium]
MITKKNISAMAFLLLIAGVSHANHPRLFEVTITNVTRAQAFTPQLVVTHTSEVSIFALGTPASLALEVMAEGGDTSGLTTELLSDPLEISDILTIPGLLLPGESVTVMVEASRHHRQLTVAAMLIPTNDTFFALAGVRLPGKKPKTFSALAYDSGTEANDQNCLNIPGPRCGGEGHSPGPNDGDEGYVYISNGFHELPEADFGEVLGPHKYGWLNPVAQVVVSRVD